MFPVISSFKDHKLREEYEKKRSDCLLSACNSVRVRWETVMDFSIYLWRLWPNFCLPAEPKVCHWTRIYVMKCDIFPFIFCHVLWKSYQGPQCACLSLLFIFTTHMSVLIANTERFCTAMTAGSLNCWISFGNLDTLISGPGSVVGIANAYGLDGPGIESRWGEIFLTSPDRPWGPPSLLYNGYRVFPGGKVLPGRDADLSPPSSAEV